MRDLMNEWKAAPRAARDVEDALWTRFRAAQDAFFARRSETFAERDAEQVENQKKKEAIIAQAAALDVSDPKAAQAALRELQAASTRSGTCPRDAMRRVDDRMRAAEQRVRDAVDAEWRAASVESNPFLAELRDRLAEAEAEARARAQVRRRGADREGRGRGRVRAASAPLGSPGSQIGADMPRSGQAGARTPMVSELASGAGRAARASPRDGRRATGGAPVRR